MKFDVDVLVNVIESARRQEKPVVQHIVNLLRYVCYCTHTRLIITEQEGEINIRLFEPEKVLHGRRDGSWHCYNCSEECSGANICLCCRAVILGSREAGN